MPWPHSVRIHSADPVRLSILTARPGVYPIAFMNAMPACLRREKIKTIILGLFGSFFITYKFTDISH